MTDLNQTYRLIALLMALLIFITSVSFTIDMHYCKDELKSVNFFGKAKSCHETSEGTVKKICPHHQKMMEQSDNCSMDKKDCCENKTYHVQADDNQQIKTDNFVENLPLQRALVAQVFQLFKQQSFENDTPNFKHYQPPLIPRDIPVLVQSFLL